MEKIIRKFVKDEATADLIEYALVFTFVLAALIFGFVRFGDGAFGGGYRSGAAEVRSVH